MSAKANCAYKSSQLVSIQSIEENEFVRKLTNNTIWIGLETRGVFRGKYIFSCMYFSDVQNAERKFETYLLAPRTVSNRQNSRQVIDKILVSKI